MITNLPQRVRSFQLAPVTDRRIGRRVWVNGKLGVIDSIGLSPYWTEMRSGVQRAYVLSLSQEDFWTDYLKLDELDYGTECYFCGENHSELSTCNDCAGCVGCCSCSRHVEPLEADEELDREYNEWLDSADRRYEEMMDMRAERNNR